MKTRSSIRDNLLVAVGSRAAYMECSRTIDLPAGSIGEDELAEFATEIVDKYINEEIDIPFDAYIFSALKGKYGKEDQV